jgi:hypothetical protein
MSGAGVKYEVQRSILTNPNFQNAKNARANVCKKLFSIEDLIIHCSPQ